jgi:RES domain-containing protein
MDITLPDDQEIKTIDIASLPSDWHEEALIPRTAAMGTLWGTSRSTAVLRVPSAVMRSENNYVLNPLHPRFRDILFEVPAVDEIDQRLRKTK